MNTDPKYGYSAPVMSFTAAPGEANRILVTQVGTDRPATLVLHDDGALVRAATGCTAIDAHTASCVAYFASVDAGDGDDAVTVRSDVGTDIYGSYPPYVRGGDGRDVLTGYGQLAGGAGDDVLTCPDPCRYSLLAGGAGSDVLRGGENRDVLSGDGDLRFDPIKTVLTASAPAGDDTIDGGGGRDRLTFEGHAAGQRVDLAAGTSAGPGGEHDALAGIEDVTGGDGDDLLLGDAGANQLEGGEGDDRISGRGGDDYLLGDLVPVDNEYSVYYTPGSDGADTLHGDAGDDVLDAGGERGDELSGGAGADSLRNELDGVVRARSVRCGSGRDTIDFVPRGQRLSDCERLRATNYVDMDIRPQRRSDGRLRLHWTCHRAPACVMAVGVRVGSSKLVRRRVTLGRDRRGSFLVRPAGAVRRGAVVDVRIVVSVEKTSEPYAARWRVVV